MTDLELASRDDLIAIIDDLEGKVAALECAAEPDVVLCLQRVFRLPPTAARMLTYLADFRPHTKEQIFNRLYADRIDNPPEPKIVDVLICKLRRQVARYGIEIETVWGSGYHMTRGREAVDAARRGETPPIVAIEGVDLPAGPEISFANVPRRHAPHGLATRRTLVELQRRQRIADDDNVGFVSFIMREFVFAAGISTPGAEMIRRLERQGYLTIHARARPGSPRRAWTIRLTDKGRAA